MSRSRPRSTPVARGFPLLALTALLLAAGCRDAPLTAPAEEAPRAAAGSVGEDPYVPGRVLALFAPGADRASIAAAYGAEPLREVVLGIWMLGVPDGREIAVASALSRTRGVVFAEPDRIRTFGDFSCETSPCTLPGDEHFRQKWDLHNDGDVNDSQDGFLASTGKVDADIDWLEAYQHLGAFTGAAKIGILDTGIRSTHEDLAGKVVAQYDFWAGDTDASDDHGHGTHVSGIAAAHGANGKGVAGVGYGANVTLVVAKVCGPSLFTYGCSSSAVAEGIKWAADQGANVLNLSFGGSTASQTEQTALQYALDRNTLPFCAAGNQATGAVSYPAAFPECVAVTATDWGDDLASYSNYGAEAELAAPGGDSEETTYGFSQIASTYYSADDGYVMMAGTSMAAPQAAGLGALLYALGVTSATEVRSRLRSTVDDLGPAGWDPYFGYGRINVYRAVSGAADGVPSARFELSCTGLGCSFTDASAPGDAALASWSWHFGDGATSTAQHPSHTYATNGSYTVTLTVTDDAGTRSSTAQTVTVSGRLARTTSGLLVHNSTTTANGATPFDTAEWHRTANVGLGLSSGALVVTALAGNGEYEFVRHGRVASRGKVFVQAVLRSTSSAVVATGVTAHHSDAAGGLNDAAGMRISIRRSPEYSILTEFVDASLTSLASAAPEAKSSNTDYRIGLFADGAALTGRDHEGVAGTGGILLSASGSRTTGGAGLLVNRPGGVDAVIQVSRFFVMADRYVRVTGLSGGMVAKVLKADGAVVAQAAESGGAASIDLVSALFAEPRVVALYQADGTTLVESYEPAGGVWGGDVYTYTEPPTARFTHSCTGLSCSFTDSSTDGDGSIASWSWSFGDGGTSTAQSPSHTYGASGTYVVALTVSDDAGALASTSQLVTVSDGGEGGGGESSITLSASGHKVKGVQHAELRWSGATSASVDVYRDGAKVGTTANDGAHTDNIGTKGGGAYSYRVCEAGTTVCSDEATVTF